MANISNSTGNTIISGTSDADSIVNFYEGNYVTIEAGDGDDTIENYSAKNILINAGEGNDSINNTGGYATILSGNGNDSINNSSSDCFINAGDGDNSIIYKGSYSTILSGAGDDSIEGQLYDGVINAGDGNNYINVSSAPFQIITGSGDDFIVSTRARVDAGAGNDTIVNEVEPNATEHKPLINGGAGNDSIDIKNYFFRGRYTINGGIGDDTISFPETIKSWQEGSIVIPYLNGDGNDVIYNIPNCSTIEYLYSTVLLTDKSKYSTLESGNDFIVKVGNDSITFKDGKGKNVKVQRSDHFFFTIYLDNSDNYKYKLGEDDGYDCIFVDASERTKKTNIVGNEYHNSIVGGKNKDYISGGVGDDTLIGGKGNDTISGGTDDDVFVYSVGEGKDVITDYDSGDRIQLTNGKIKKIATNKKGDVTFTIGKGSIKLKGAVGKKIEIIDSYGETFFKQVIGKKSIDITDSDIKLMNLAMNTAVVTIDGSTRTDDITILANSKNNLIQLGTGNATVTAGKGKDTLVYAGGNLNIMDYQTGKDVIKLKDSTITSATVDGSVVNFTTNKGTITVNGAVNKKGKIQKITFADTVGSVFNFTANNSAQSIVGSKKADTLNGTTGNDYLKGGKGNDVFFFSAGNDTIADYSISKNNTDEISLASSLVYSNHYITGKKDKDVLITFQNQSSDTTTLTLINAKGKSAKINGTAYDFSDSTTKPFIEESCFLESKNLFLNDINLALQTNQGVISMANVIKVTEDDKVYNGSPEVDYIIAKSDIRGATIDAGTGDDFIGNYQGNFENDSSINAGSGNDYIYNNYGGYSHSIINGGRGDDTIVSYDTGTIEYANGDGDDIVEVAEDSSNIIYINLTSGTLDKISGNGSNVDLKIGEGSIKLQGATGKIINIYNNDSDKYYLFDGTHSLNVINVTEKTLMANNSNDYIYNSYYRSTIDASAGDDTIYGGSSANLVNGGAGNDFIYNCDTAVGGLGDDTIKNVNVVQYTTGDGDDLLIGHASGDTIQVTGNLSDVTANGNDVILTIGTGKITIKDAIENLIRVQDSTGNKYYIFDGRNMAQVNCVNENQYTSNKIGDYIYGIHWATILASSGDDTIYSTSHSSINGSAGNDSIYAAYESTVRGGVGDDTIHYNSSNVLIQYSKGDGNDVVLESNDDEDSEYASRYNNATIKVTDDVVGDINGSGNDITINIGTGSIKLKDVKDRVIWLQDTTGNKSFMWNGEEVINAFKVDSNNFTASTGKDYIYTQNGKATINAGLGDDTIVAGNFDVIQYSQGDGKDVLIDLGYEEYENDTKIQLKSGTLINSQVNGDDVVFNVSGDGSITFKNVISYTNFSIIDPAGKVTNYFYDGERMRTDVTYNRSENKVIEGTGDSDFIVNYGDGSTINAGAGDDSINDLGYTTINAGAGDDTINLNYHYSDNLIQYNQDDGNDVINYLGDFEGVIELGAGVSVTGYSINGNRQTLQLGSGSMILNSDDEVIFTNSNIDNKLKLTVRMIGSDSKVTNLKYVNGRKFYTDFKIDKENKNSTISGTAEGDYIETRRKSVTIDGASGDDYILLDKIQNNSSINAGAGDDTIFANMLQESKINGGAGDDKIQVRGKSYDDFVFSGYFNDNGKPIWTSIVNSSINGSDGNDLIEYEAASVKEQYYCHDDEDDTENADWKSEWSYGSGITIAGGKGNDTIRNTFIVPKIYDYSSSDDGYSYINKGYMKDTNTYVTIYSYSYNGYTIMDTVTSTLIYNRMIQYAEGDGDDVIEDYNVGDTLSIACDWATELSGSNDILIKMGIDSDNPTGSIKLLGSLGKKININGTEYDTGSALDKVTLTNKDKSPYTATSMVGTIDGSSRTKAISITGNSYANSIVGGSGKNTISGEAGNDTLIGGKAADVINGGAGNDVLDGGAGNDKLNGGDGKDTLTGGKGNDNLTGGAGEDIFIYASGDGKDVIVDYVAGEDVIQLTSGAVTKVATDKKGNLTFTVDKSKGTFKVNDGKGKLIHIIDKDGNTLINQKFGDKLLTVTDDDSATVNASIDAAVVTVDSSARTLDVNIIANNNTKGNIIQLGKGNSTLTTGKGKDTIIANESGQILITDYEVGKDKLKLTTELTAASLSGSDVILGAGNTSITLNNAQGKKITVIDKDGGTSSKVYGDKVVTITNKDGDTFKALVGEETLDASKRSKAISLTANSEGTTLIGGKGNDTLTGGAGKDTFVYNKNSKNDTIVSYAADDVIQLGTKAYITDTEVSGNDYIFKFNKNTLTVVDGANKNITFTDSNNNKIIYKAILSADLDSIIDSNAELGMRNEELAVRDFDELTSNFAAADNSECGMRNAQLGATSRAKANK